MNRPRACLIAALVAVSAIAAAATAHAGPSATSEKKSKQFELKADYPLAGDTWHQRTVIQPMSADAMIATSYLSFGKVP